tara:strand:+ start:501 stop:653 length:153 start_codon:yes stop_codon:yes gene_type:complete
MEDVTIMGEKEFFDIMKNSNRLLTMEERHLIATLTQTIIKSKRRKNERIL